MKKVNVEVREKFNIEGFATAEPKLYEGVNQIQRLSQSTLLYVDNVCVASIDNFYHTISIV